MNIILHNSYDVMNRDENLFCKKLSAKYENNLSHFIYLKKLCTKLKINIGTYYSINLKSADTFIFIDHPKLNDPVYQFAIQNKKDSYLVIFENSMINPFNFNQIYHTYFIKVFAWGNLTFDNVKYIPLSYKFDIPNGVMHYKFNDRKLLTLIAANKLFVGPGELYSTRRQIIKWFNQNYPNSFSFYGRDWNFFRLPMNSKLSFFNKFNIPNFFEKSLLKSYAGECPSKKPILQQHLFCICFENSSNEPGYITEKIFDCFFNGCIPIYFGAPNIKEYIDESCFVDFRDFDTLRDLFNFISSFDEEMYIKYLKNINNFLNSKKGLFFSHKNFARTLLRSILN
jgi:hypothetical protein